MASDIDKIIDQMRQGPNNVRFNDLCKVCDHYFGSPRHNDGSHAVYKMPWFGDPRVNIQNEKGKGKGYQVNQVLKAIEKLELEKELEKKKLEQEKLLKGKKKAKKK